MTKKRILPVPLILLTPIVLLILVVIAGVYRFSLPADSITAKFSRQVTNQDAVMLRVFGIKTPNPWTVKVPETQVYSFIQRLDNGSGLAQGYYQDQAVRGTVTLDTRQLIQLNETLYAVIMRISNQGTGIFYYLTLFDYDKLRHRMISRDAYLLGDRIEVERLEQQGQNIQVRVKQRKLDQPMVQKPKTADIMLFEFDERALSPVLK
ncbi:hypothetical protein GCM10007938_29570 [Vibrio zhanjiangensis]|uniref:Uncharacterized protein n=1 Tax=Vibrio zhanjiangensis TaxID=1046128 RepID=A0ABQ6F315_9VIBR|nr:hypothetical protein [Vibrio zhanjiangensis]GLT19175.1 hypothetical protein GCM10007938_29570 [Vibrio zhanjiangensis]